MGGSFGRHGWEYKQFIWKHRCCVFDLLFCSRDVCKNLQLVYLYSSAEKVVQDAVRAWRVAWTSMFILGFWLGIVFVSLGTTSSVAFLDEAGDCVVIISLSSEHVPVQVDSPVR